MLTKTLAATAAVSMLVCGGAAIAAPQAKSAVNGPKQPIPYSQLDAYLKASPKMRANKDWWAGSTMAPTGTPADTSATAPAMPMRDTPMRDTAVNPPGAMAPPSMPMTPPTNATPPDGSGMSNQPGAPATPPMTPPTEPK